MSEDKSSDDQNVSNDGATAGGGAALPPAPGDSNPLLSDLTIPITCQVQLSGPPSWQHLLTGIDTLDVGLYVDWGEGWNELLQLLDIEKKRAEGGPGLRWQYLNAPEMLILPRGMPPMYAFHLQHPITHLFLGRGKSGEKYPNAYASILSQALWAFGPLEAVNQLQSMVGNMQGQVGKVQPSRVDLCADFQIPGGLTHDFMRRLAVSRSRDFSEYLKGSTLETFYCGSDGANIRLRVYDKSKEIIHSDKPWFNDLWRVDTPGDVWRVEFQLRRGVLKQFGVNSIDDLRLKSGGIWSFLTEKWFSLRLLDNDNAKRRTIHPWWLAVQSLSSDFGQAITVKRDRPLPNCADAKWYVSHAGGCVVGYAARNGIGTLLEALEKIGGDIAAYFYGKDFEERVRVMRYQLGLTDAEGGAT